MSQPVPRDALAGPGMMFISAAIFGYFGFSSSFNPTGSAGQFLLYVPMLEWTLKASCVAFAVAGAVTFARPILGNIIYGAFGLVAGAMFATVAVMDILDTQHTVMSPLLLIIFALWNGYGAWIGLRATLAASAAHARRETFDLPDDAQTGA